jgi:hypothetical protein
MDGEAGVTDIETSVADVTVSAADPLTEPDIAVIVAVPCATPVARPAVELIVATVGALELHCTVLVMF